MELHPVKLAEASRPARRCCYLATTKLIQRNPGAAGNLGVINLASFELTRRAADSDRIGSKDSDNPSNTPRSDARVSKTSCNGRISGRYMRDKARGGG